MEENLPYKDAEIRRRQEFLKKRGDKRGGSEDRGETSLTRVLETRSYRVLFRGLMASKLSFSYLEWRPEGADPAVNGHLQRRWERLRREKTGGRRKETTNSQQKMYLGTFVQFTTNIQYYKTLTQ